MASRILIIEDDTDLREGLEFSFACDGYEVSGVGTKKGGLREVKEGIYNMVLLDCNLPDGTGFELCREVRAFSDVPMIMLTARDGELDEIKALELGVDDYLSKPFSLGVLKARMKRLLNEQAHGKRAGERLVSRNITIDKNTCKAYKNDVEISLSKLEYRLLNYLIENRNHVLSKEQILSHMFPMYSGIILEGICLPDYLEAARWYRWRCHSLVMRAGRSIGHGMDLAAGKSGAPVSCPGARISAG